MKKWRAFSRKKSFLIRKSTFLFAENSTSLFAEIGAFLFAENDTLLFTVYNFAFIYYSDEDFNTSYYGYKYIYNYLIHFNCNDERSIELLLECKQKIEDIEINKGNWIELIDTEKADESLRNDYPYYHKKGLPHVFYSIVDTVNLYDSIEIIKTKFYDLFPKNMLSNVQNIKEKIDNNYIYITTFIRESIKSCNSFLKNSEDFERNEFVNRLMNDIIWVNTVFFSDYESYIRSCESIDYLDIAKDELEKIYWDKIIEGNNITIKDQISNCYEYMNMFKYGIHYCEVESILWDCIKEINKTKYYRVYVKKYPKGRFNEKAQQYISFILF